MSTRIATHGRLIDRSVELRFAFNDTWLRGHPGDTLASALLANDKMLVGRSFKYHRPRGIVASGVEEPNALVNLGKYSRHEPNRRATAIELFDKLQATSQNHWPSLEFDVGAIGSALARFLPAGFYYKTFIHPRPFWKHIYEPFIRQCAGLGKAPDPESRDPDSYEHFYAHVDVLIVGGGVAGLAAAKSLAETGAEVLAIEQSAHWGGRAPVDGGPIDGQSPATWVAETVAALEAMPNVRLRLRTAGAGVYDHGYVLGYERLADRDPEAEGPRHRLWRIRTKQAIVATGAIERPLGFAGNDIPGVMLASAVRDYLVNYGVAVGERTAIATNNDDGYRTAIALKKAGLEVPIVIDARATGGGALMETARSMGIRVETGKAIADVAGRKRVTGVRIAGMTDDGSAEIDLACDAVAMAGGWSPVVHLWSHCGGKLAWDAEGAQFRPDPDRAPTGADGAPFAAAAGSASGVHLLGPLLGDATAVAGTVATRLGRTAKAQSPKADAQTETPIEPVWLMPADAGYEQRSKAWLDFQNDVKIGDVRLAAREGFESVEHAKRYTTLGMATDQGKLSNINGIATLADALRKDIPAVGTTTFRPPYTPISMGAIGGEARGKIFQPIRKTPMHDWHDANGADWEPVGHWRRPYAFLRAGESIHDAVMREVANTRQNLGLFDASTLGKLIVKGPDAGRFLDMLYTGTMSTLKIGKCRYGLMCSENGFLIDDGVLARLDEDTWLCHTTTGGADRIHAHMEEWLQTEWWDWKVWIVNATEHYAQVAVVGPNARKVLEKLGGMDVSKEALAFMEWKDGTIGGFDVRAYRISFSGELSYEIAVKAGDGQAFWDALIEAGQEFDVMPYGTECLHVMRAEKGFIAIGDETDGTVIPQDLGLNWAISKKKQDFLGKRAQERSHMTDPNRWRLVGLETADGKVLPDGAYAVGTGYNANGQKNTIGRVTSTYFSPTLGKGIALGLVEHGPDRMGEVLDFPGTDGTIYKAKIVDPVFYDKDGEKQNV